MSPPPCEVCKELNESVSIQHGVPLQRIRQSSTGTWLSRGCSRCGVLLRSILALKDAKDDEKNLVVSWDTKRLQGLRVVVQRDAEASQIFSIDVFCLPGDRAPWKLQKHGETATDISGDTESEAAISKISQWIEQCASSHSCRKFHDEHYLPTRVLDISNPSLVRLHHTAQDEQKQYACLSHCWGSTRFLTTTSSNLEEHKQSIPWSRLPRSFQDAIAISRRLGIPYLWVGSLCIIQDSQRDWQAESSEMASIYAHGTITLAATKSASDLDSFFSRAPPFYRSQKLQYKSDQGRLETIHIRRTLTHGHGPSPFPLLSRGWVLQERLLSPRVVHFTSDELIWECMEQMSCECGCIRFLWAPGFVPFNKDLLYTPNLARASKSELTASWHQIVEQYSRLELSFSRDKLPAILGAAKKFSPYKGSQYYVGMWKDSFIRDLMWARNGRLETTRRLNRVPSWSWVSIDTQVVFDEAVSTTELATVVEVKKSKSREHEDGASNANLQFLTRELNVQNGLTLDPSEFTQTWSSIRISGFLVHLPHTAAGNEQLNLDGTPYSFNPFAELEKLGELVLDIKQDTCEDCAADIYCLRLARMTGTMGSGENQEVSLLLFRTDSVEHTYRRLGLLKIGFRGAAPGGDLYENVSEPTLVQIQ